MTETKMTARKPAVAAGGWSAHRLALIFYPAAAAAVWINLFMLSLLLTWLAVPNLSPAQAVFWALVLGVPAAMAAGRWVRGLMDKANRRR